MKKVVETMVQKIADTESQLLKLAESRASITETKKNLEALDVKADTIIAELNQYISFVLTTEFFNKCIEVSSLDQHSRLNLNSKEKSVLKSLDKTAKYHAGLLQLKKKQNWNLKAKKIIDDSDSPDKIKFIKFYVNKCYLYNQKALAEQEE